MSTVTPLRELSLEDRYTAVSGPILLDGMQALREILLNAMEHGAAFNPEQVVEVTAIRTARTMVFRVRDPGAGDQHGIGAIASS